MVLGGREDVACDGADVNDKDGDDGTRDGTDVNVRDGDFDDRSSCPRTPGLLPVPCLNPKDQPEMPGWG